MRESPRPPEMGFLREMVGGRVICGGGVKTDPGQEWGKGEGAEAEAGSRQGWLRAHS